MTDHPNNPELLAPAGTLDAGLAAFDAGADAVYAGLARFNARERGRNFTPAELSKLVAYARKHGRKVYVTLNTLVKEGELDAVLEMLAELAVLRPDAVIVQDLGVVRLIREHFPVLSIHASTQMGIHNSAGARVAERMGIARVILERQITFAEIAEIREHCAIELEVFVHGALCCSRAGACLFSSWMGGWSGNRGKCKQPCRRRYFSDSGNGFFFSTKDLYTLESIPVLRAMGIAGFKIEGRLRQADYVRRVVAAYRLMLDAAPDAGPETLKQARHVLGGALGRKWAAGFRSAAELTHVIQHRALGASGLLCGRVLETDAGRFQVKLTRPLQVKDRIRIQPDSGDEGPTLTLTRLTVDGRPAARARKDQTCWIHFDREVPAKALVYKLGEEPADATARIAALPEAPATVDLEIALSPAESPCTPDGGPASPPRASLPAVPAAGRDACICVRVAGTEAAWTGTLELQHAEKHPLTADQVASEFRRSRSPRFDAGRVAVSVPPQVFLPASRLKTLRRAFWDWAETHVDANAVRAAWRDRAELARQALCREPCRNPPLPPAAVVRLPGAERNPVPGSVTARAISDWSTPEEEAVLPDFCTEGELADLRRQVRALAARGARRFRVTSLFGFDLLDGLAPGLITATFPLPACNSAAVQELAALGAQRVTAWVELDRAALDALLARCGGLCEVFVYGRIPLLSSRYRLPAAGQIRDSRGARFTVEQDGALTCLFPEKVLAIPAPACAGTYTDLSHARPGEPQTDAFNYLRELA
ncbi:MAG: U32 family peptidase [Kiritimatiellae bacterium]|nr:U32 family peptidase [Kiritimatiellia bacterium]